MKKFLTLALALLLALSTVLCFAACNPTGTEAETTAAGASEETTGAEEGTGEATTDTEKKVITVGYTLYAPMNYEENGELVGFDTDLAKAVFENLGYSVQFKLIDWNNKYVDLESGNIDCIWNGFTANTTDDDGVARADKVDFSYNYMLNQQAIVVKADDVAAYTDVATSFVNKIGYAEEGSAGEEYAKTLTDAVIQTATYQTDALMQVKSGSADFAVVDILLAKSMAGNGDYADLAIVTAIEAPAEYYAIGFKKGSDLTAKVNAELEKLAADGTIATLADKYGVANSAIKDFSDQK